MYSGAGRVDVESVCGDWAIQSGPAVGSLSPVASWPDVLLPRHQTASRPVVMPHSLAPPTSTIVLTGMALLSGAAKVRVTGDVVPLPQHLTPEAFVAHVRPDPASMSMDPAAAVTTVGDCLETVEPIPS